MFPGMKFWGSATVGTKGQVVIPAEAREALHIKVGDKLVVLVHPTREGLVLVKAEAIEEMLQHLQTDLTEIQKSNLAAEQGNKS